MVPHLPLGFPVACCLLAFSMACFLCSSVMEKPGGRAHVRSRLAFFNSSCASFGGLPGPGNICPPGAPCLSYFTGWHGRGLLPHLLNHPFLPTKGESKDPLSHHFIPSLDPMTLSHFSPPALLSLCCCGGSFPNHSMKLGI